MADRTLVVKLVGDEQDLIRSYTKAGRATKQFGNTTDTALGKADKRLRSLKTAGAGFAGGLIASEVLSNVTTFIDKAAESQAVLTQVQQGLRNTGQTWDQYGQQIDKAVRAQSKLGFDDEELLRSFDKFNRQVGNVNKALGLNAIAMDVARGRAISLEQATTLVTKAAAGQRGALTRLGIEVDKNATKVDLLRTLTEKYGGSAAAAANDASTAQARLGVEIENVQETLGTLLLPAVGQLATGLSDAAVAADLAITNIRSLGSMKVPVLDVPINFTVGGKSIFDRVKDLTGQALLTPQVRAALPFVNALADRNKDKPIVIQTETNLDGEAVGRSTKKVTEKDLRRNPRQKRGPNSAYR